MLLYALRRLLAAIPTLFFVILLAFLMMHAAPGGPFDSERVLPADVEANVSVVSYAAISARAIDTVIFRSVS